MRGKLSAVLFALLAGAWLTGGTQCFFAVSSGGSADEDEETRGGLIVIINDGDLGEVPVAGVSFRTASLSGITGGDGEFSYREGETVTFSIGDIRLGEAVAGQPMLGPAELVAGSTADAPAVINVARLLLSLDAVADDGSVTIPDGARAAARSSNPEIAAAIETLDFADETAFVNAASQIVAVLTADYGFTAVLVDAETAARFLAGDAATR